MYQHGKNEIYLQDLLTLNIETIFLVNNGIMFGCNILFYLFYFFMEGLSLSEIIK